MSEDLELSRSSLHQHSLLVGLGLDAIENVGNEVVQLVADLLLYCLYF